MTVGVFDLFKLGVGPSSSHTMGPMTAAARFAARLRGEGLLARTARVQTKLYASLALTGKGHHTDRAVILGLMGHEPAALDPDAGDAALKTVASEGRLWLGGDHIIGFDPERDIVWARRERLPQHPNALTFTALSAADEPLTSRTYFSVGGGFVRDEDDIGRNAPDEDTGVPHPFESGETLLAQAKAAGLTIAGLMLRNELAHRSAEEVEAGLDRILEAMDACIERGMRQHGELPGGLNVRRRAAQVREAILARMEHNVADPLAAMDWVNLWAMAVSRKSRALRGEPWWKRAW